jgi:hypothetical protein
MFPLLIQLRFLLQLTFLFVLFLPPRSSNWATRFCIYEGKGVFWVADLAGGIEDDRQHCSGERGLRQHGLDRDEENCGRAGLERKEELN